MKPTDIITTIFNHNLWANVRLLKFCAGLTGEQLETAIPGSAGSIRETLAHIVIAEQSYFSRISTGQRLSRPENAPSLTIAEMIESAQTTGQGLIAWATKVQAADVVEIDWDGVMRDVPKAIILTQAINHAAEHREQVKATLTHLGIEPPNVQGWAYFDENAAD